jgi:uncharacterized SAM-binding protein YcdF (DUF218 family)
MAFCLTVLGSIAAVLFVHDLFFGARVDQHPMNADQPFFSVTAWDANEDAKDQALADLDVEKQLCERPAFDAVLVLGGGRPEGPDKPPRWTRRRCDIAGRLYQCRERKRLSNALTPASTPTAVDHIEYYLSLSAGSAHVGTMLDHLGFPIFESTASAAYLSHRWRIPSTLLLIETSSYDTIGNAFWARTSHIDVRGWSDLLIITSSFHMDRTKQIFDWVFALPSDAAAQTVQKTVETTEPHTDSEHTTMRKSTVGRFRLTYVEASDEGLSPEMIKTRREKEQKSLETVKELEQQIRTLPALHHWLSTKHDLYAPARFLSGEERQHSSNRQLRASYGN